LWIQNKASDWFALVEQTPIEPLAGVALTVAGIPPGPCTVEWWDTTTGKITATERLKAGKDGLALKLPVVASDVAAKVRY